jgi:SAM-dependent methyltransferase
VDGPPPRPHAASGSRRRTEWWRDYFDESFLQLHHALFSEEDSRREVGAMIELLGLHAGARILDAPCGWGRHARLFPQAGIDAFGADLSVPLLTRARSDATQGDQTARFAATDVRALPFADGTFDAVVNVFTSLGLFVDDDEDLRALREARRVLRPGGAFLLESMHRDDVVCAYAARDRWTLPDGTEVRVRRRFDPITGISHERLRWRRGQERGEKRHALRLRTATDIDRLLAAAGFPHREYLGDWTGEPFAHDSPRLIVLARSDADQL